MQLVRKFSYQSRRLVTFEMRVMAPCEVQLLTPRSCVCRLALQGLPDAFSNPMPCSKGLLVKLSSLCGSHTIPQYELLRRREAG